MSEIIDFEPKTAYTLRDLNSKDIFGMVQIIKNVGIKEFKGVLESDSVREAIAAATDGGGNVDVSKVGVSVVLELASVIVCNLDNAEDDIYKFLEGVSGIGRKKLEAMSMADFMQMIVDVIRKPDFKDFFKVASKLLS